jgi:hypothetical protein
MVGVVKCADEKEIIIVPTLRKARLEHHFRRQKIRFIGDKMVFGDSFSADKMVFGDSFRRLFSKFERRKYDRQPGWDVVWTGTRLSNTCTEADWL